MNRALILLLALVVAAVVLGLILAGPLSPGSGGPAERASTADRENGATVDGPAGPPGALEGSVVSALSGQPVEGAAVRASFTGPQGTSEHRVLTDAAGAFRFAALPPFEGYRITASAESYALGLVEGVEIRSRETTTLEPIALGRPVLLEGVVVDLRDRPVEGARISVHLSRDLMFEGDWIGTFRNFTTAEKPIAETETDARGRFVLETLSAGRYNLRATARGFAPADLDDVLVAPGPRREPIRLVLGAGAILEGIVVDRENEPVAGATVALGNFAGFARIFQDRETTVTSLDGRFIFPSVATGQYVLVVRAEGNAAVVRAPLKVPVTGELRIRIAGRAVLSGIVKGPSGEGVAGALVLAATGPVGITYEMVETAPDGSYRIENLATGQLLMFSVTKEGFVTHPAQGMFGGRGVPGIRLKAGEETRFDVTLRHGAAVIGRVLTTKGEPIVGALVRAMSRSTMLDLSHVETGEDGSYRIEGVGPGRCVLLARAPGYFQPINERAMGAIFSRRQNAEGVEGTIVEIGRDDKTVTADVILRAACTVSGRVLDPEDNPVGGARVSVAKPDWARFVPFRFDLTGGADVQTVSEKDGSFRLPGVNAGETVRITATTRGYAPGRSPDLKLEPGAEMSGVELRLGAGGVITGTVRTSEGDVVPGALVRVAPSGQEWALVWGAGDPDPVRTDEQGRFEKPVFGTDPVSVRVDADGFVSETVPKVEVKAGETADELSITIRAALSIEGMVLGPDNVPVAEAFVRARAEGQRRGFQDLSAHSDANGSFRIEGLDVGKYTLITQSSLAPEQRMEKIDAGVAGVVIRLPRGRRIQGHVVGPAGEPIAHVSLRADRTGGGRSRVTTDERGAFLLDNLQDGKWRIRYRPDAGNPDAYLPAEVKDVETGSSDVLLTLREGLDVSGRILDSAGGGARGATVVLTQKDDRRSTFTSAGGAFRLGGLPEGSWTLTVTGASGEAGRIDGVSSGTLDVLLQLEPALAITGRVLDPTGRPPVEPVFVAATPEGSSRAVAFVMTDLDGSFALAGLPAGRYVVASGDQEAGLEAKTTVPAGTNGVVLRLQHVQK